MDILPAIDLRDGKCVRLLQGDYDRQIDYNDDPVDQADQFARAGARWLHVVDLDGAREGVHYNLEALQAIRAGSDLNIQIGGGIRSEQSVKKLLDIGVSRVIVGTRALEDLQWFEKLVHDYPNQIVLGLDARNGMISTHGWTETSTTPAQDLAQRVTDWPLAAIVYTDIARDGMMTGPNIPATEQIAQSCNVGIIASGGMSKLADIEQLAQLPLAGIIIGRALYEGTIDLKAALEVVQK